MLTRWTLVALGIASATMGCGGSEPAGGTDSSTSEETSSAASTSMTQSDPPTSSTAVSSSTSGSDTGDSVSPTESEDSSSTGRSGSSDSTGAPSVPGVGCPQENPAEWILCEDFENFENWGNFWTNDDLIAVEPGPSNSGEMSLRIGHQVGQYGSGMADIRFGQGPNDSVVARPDDTFREVWVRFFIRTDENWPANQGISEGIEVMSVVGGNRSIAVDATVYSPSQAEAQLIPWSCVHDSQLLCSSGNSDWGNPDLRALATQLGTSPLYGDELAGQWQCHEMHVRLDDPGQANGVLEFWADNALEVSLQRLEFVGSWDGAGLNTVRFASFWGSQAGLDHHVDDVIVSTAPIGCP
ncbi:MAG: hypothetical protein KUG77_27350 [Nannocystaceae bacterium]|nr:hypothetical protein [Nannocystaceae bacterium]